jgi:hypothetical protein
MLASLGHRVRWIVVWVFLLAWVLTLMLDLGGGLGNLLLVLAVVVLFYELLAVDRSAG